MQSRWNDKEAQALGQDLVKLRVYTSRLLGQEPSLVLHGGGNTSVKTKMKNLFGEEEEVLRVKGSGWDLATIQPEGFVPVRMDLLHKAVRLEQLSDLDMVRLQRQALTDPALPSPSVEAILHAIIPCRFVDHTHADAIVTLSNTPHGESLLRDIFGDRVLILPYIMPGFQLAKQVWHATRKTDWKKLDGIILMHHGVFTFNDDAKTSYEQMLHLVTLAEARLPQPSPAVPPAAATPEDLLALAEIRLNISQAKGSAVVAHWDADSQVVGFANDPRSLELASRGPLTPDHVIRTKPFPVLLAPDAKISCSRYVDAYCAYFKRHAAESLTCLNPAPCWALWPDHGVVSFGSLPQDASIISDIVRHTLTAIAVAEKLGGWKPLPESDVFQLEYWELEQAKLKKSGPTPAFQGKVVLVTGAASGIGKACVEMFLSLGACVAAWDRDPALAAAFPGQRGLLTQICDVTDPSQTLAAVQAIIRQFGGLDVLVSNAGIFPASETLAEMNAHTWHASLDVNLTSHQSLLQQCIPYLSLGLNPTVVLIASKNVPAPGAGAGAYSVAKAGLTQLGRVAALELAPRGIRVNMVHPNAVFDTKIWTPEVLATRAAHYHMTVEAYKTNNLLKVEVTSRDVARLVASLAGEAFAKTTGAQVPVDGGNDRVI